MKRLSFAHPIQTNPSNLLGKGGRESGQIVIGWEFFAFDRKGEKLNPVLNLLPTLTVVCSVHKDYLAAERQYYILQYTTINERGWFVIND